MKHERLRWLVTFSIIIATAALTVAFRDVLWYSLDILWVAPMLIVPYFAVWCRHVRFPVPSRARLYALGGATIGYLLTLPLSVLVTPLTRGLYVSASWLAIGISVPIAGVLAASLSIRGCRRHATPEFTRSMDDPGEHGS